jgi:hypothetical protein
MNRKAKTVFVVNNNGSIIDTVYTTLKGACGAVHGVSYSSALKGKRVFATGIRGEHYVQIVECYVETVTGREDNHKGKRK